MKNNRTYYAGFHEGVRLTAWSPRQDAVYHNLRKQAEQREWRHGTHAVYSKSVPVGFNVQMALSLCSGDQELQKKAQAEWDAFPVCDQSKAPPDNAVKHPLFETVVATKERRAIWPGVLETSVSIEDVVAAKESVATAS